MIYLPKVTLSAATIFSFLLCYACAQDSVANIPLSPSPNSTGDISVLISAPTSPVTTSLPLSSQSFSTSTAHASLETTAPTARPRKPPKLAKAAAIVCKSPQFALTPENWRDSQASAFLKQWVSTRPISQRNGHGLIEAMALEYLGRSELKCGLKSSQSCMVTCNEVISLVPDPTVARALYFVITAARHYLEVMEVADAALLAAQVNVGMWTKAMAKTIYWTQETDHDRVFKMSANLLNSLVPLIMFSVAPTIPFQVKDLAIQDRLNKLEKLKPAEGLSTAEFDTAKLKLIEEKQELLKQLAHVKSAANWARTGYNALAFGIPAIGIPASSLLTWESYEKPQALNIHELGLAVSAMVSEARMKNAEAVQQAFSGKIQDVKGNTLLGSILDAGNFLAVDSQMLELWSGDLIEGRLTDALKYRIMSEALKSQGVYIQCTTDFNSPSCEGDTRGPQNLKACIDGRVCYMNKWSGRGYWWRHHVEEPFGVDQFGDWPYMVTPEDMILSSYKTNQLIKADSKNAPAVTKLMSQEKMLSPHSYLDSSAPGAFFLPVCINDRWHQNTPLDDMTLWDNFNQNSDKKTLPCSCGEWGADTEAFWRDSGLAKAKHEQKYRTSFCPRQLKTKLGTNKLERFVADCRLKIHKTGLGYKDGPHEACEPVLALIERHGKGPDEIDPFLKLALECNVRLHVSSIRKKVKPECTPYMKGGLEALISKKNPMAAKWGFI